MNQKNNSTLDSNDYCYTTECFQSSLNVIKGKEGVSVLGNFSDDDPLGIKEGCNLATTLSQTYLDNSYNILFTQTNNIEEHNECLDGSHSGNMHNFDLYIGKEQADCLQNIVDKYKGDDYIGGRNDYIESATQIARDDFLGTCLSNQNKTPEPSSAPESRNNNLIRNLAVTTGVLAGTALLTAATVAYKFRSMARQSQEQSSGIEL